MSVRTPIKSRACIRSRIECNAVLGDELPPARDDARALQSAPGLTAGQRARALSRLQAVRMVVQVVALRRKLQMTWCRRPIGVRRATRCPSPRYVGDVHARLVARGVCFCSEKTLREWVRAYLDEGPLGLVDRRGRGRKPLAAIDSRLWGELVRRVAHGGRVATVDRELRPRALDEGRAWPALRTLQARITGVRGVLRRNRHLLLGGFN